MSNSPWSGPAVFRQIRREIVAIPELNEGGTLILDECADEKSGEESASVARQYNVRRELMRAALPVAQLTPVEAVRAVVTRLARRARSIGCRLRVKIARPDTS